MNTLVIDRSTDTQSVAWVKDSEIVASETLDGLDCRSGEWTVKVRDFIARRCGGEGAPAPSHSGSAVCGGEGAPAPNAGASATGGGGALAPAALDRIVVGTGPGSFAGIRAALAFAQGYAIGSHCEVLGLPSPCANAPAEGPLAVVGDARRGKFWIALFDGYRLVRPVFQTGKDELDACIPLSAPVVSPDDARIGATLKEMFAARYRGEAKPTAGGLARFFLAAPSSLKSEPLPIYLNPAVRDDVP